MNFKKKSTQSNEVKNVYASTEILTLKKINKTLPEKREEKIEKKSPIQEEYQEQENYIQDLMDEDVYNMAEKMYKELNDGILPHNISMDKIYEIAKDLIYKKKHEYFEKYSKEEEIFEENSEDIEY